MSLRALGRQFKANVALRNAPYMGGNEGRPQGVLFGAHTQERGRFPLPRATVEAGRRYAAGEKNPAVPWREPHWSDKWATPDPGAPTYPQGKLF